MFENILKKGKCLDCYLLKHSLHFFYNEIRACCSNAKGPVFYPNYDGSNVNWDYVYKKRKTYIKKLNSLFDKTTVPEECIGCFEIANYMTNKKIENFPNVVEKVYFQNYMSCNAKCTYCTFAEEGRGYKYKVIPLVKSLIDKNILSKHAAVYMSGGEITISPEFEELLKLLTTYLENKVEIFTSGIKYCKSIEEAFIQDKLTILLSIDSGSRETYKKIKLVDSFDNVVSNLKKYTEATENAKNNITLKYILVDETNDNIEEIKNFFELVQELGIKNVRLDFDYTKYTLCNQDKIPKHYFELYEYFQTEAKRRNLKVYSYELVDKILNKNN